MPYKLEPSADRKEPRPPYFHDGSARDLAAVVAFYETRFAIGLTADQKEDLAAFLAALRTKVSAARCGKAEC